VIDRWVATQGGLKSSRGEGAEGIKSRADKEGGESVKRGERASGLVVRLTCRDKNGTEKDPTRYDEPEDQLTKPTLPPPKKDKKTGRSESKGQRDAAQGT